jgi:hypothetical protein
MENNLMKTLRDLHIKQVANSHTLHFYVDKNNAPAGYYPVPKAEIGNRFGNICRACEWRPDCDGSVCSCMADKRPDGIGVVFKKIVEVKI